MLEFKSSEEEEAYRKFEASDPFGFDADCRWDEVDYLVSLINSTYSAYEFKANDHENETIRKLWFKHKEMRRFHWEKTGEEYEKGILELKIELEKAREMLTKIELKIESDTKTL